MEGIYMRKCKKCLFTFSGVTIIILSIAIALSLTSCYVGYSKITVDGKTRYYRIHIPSKLDTSIQPPLLLAFHQFSDTARGMEKLTQLNDYADREQFIVVYPQGRWRTWKTDPIPNDDTRFIEELIQFLVLEYRVDPGRIYATGASAGGMMIQAFACYSDKISAIAPVMGSMTQEHASQRKPIKNIPVLIIHGTKDPVVPYDGGATHAGIKKTTFLSAEENAKWWATQYGCQEEPLLKNYPDTNRDDNFTTEIFDFKCNPRVMLYKVNGGGHTWPGGKNRYPKFIVGPTAPEPDATYIIVKFFQNNAL